MRSSTSPIVLASLKAGIRKLIRGPAAAAVTA
jgi:hypothetical protein